MGPDMIVWGSSRVVASSLAGEVSSATDLHCRRSNCLILVNFRLKSVFREKAESPRASQPLY